LAVVAAAATACGGPAAPSVPTASRLVPLTRVPASDASVLSGQPGAVSAAVAAGLFRFAPVIVVAGATGHANLPAAAAQAERLHAPLLLADQAARPGSTGAAGRPSADPAVRAEVRRLGARVVLDVGADPRRLSAQLPGVTVVTSPSALPRTIAPAAAGRIALLVQRGDESPATLAAAATARAAGGTVILVSGFDPRADPAAIAALAAVRPDHVVAIGAGFGPEPLLASRVAVAATGVQLPGGGQVLFPGRRLVAMYGYPGTPALGVLGRQGLAASIARARRLAAAYRPLSSIPVVPTFEILATVAQGSPGPDGSYSYQTPVATLRPWVRRASAAGLYVVLDLQPGRADLLAQAKRYRPLLTRPNVGLALDPEWKLQPGQRPLHQIGSVRISEVNSVVRWLSQLTAQYRLPQKLLVLHQFRLSMIAGEQQLDTSHDDLAIVVHMDGQGTPGEKLQTWRAVTAAAPNGVFFGWKNFLVKDTPMFTPRQTMARSPQPVMISYQ